MNHHALSPVAQRINPLTIEQRENALKRARLAIAGQEPQLEDFMQRSFSKWPPAYKKWTRRGLMALIAAAFLVSAIRVGIAGAVVFYASLTKAGIPDPFASVLAFLVGAAFIVLAETGQVIFMIQFQQELKQGNRGLLMFGAVICTLIALAGNAAVVGEMKPFIVMDGLTPRGGEADAFWIFLETYSPPIIVLLAMTVLKSHISDEVIERHNAQEAYVKAYAAWSTRHDNAEYESTAKWLKVSARFLRDEIREANRRSKAVLRDLTNDDWQMLVMREHTAENWFTVTRENQALVIAQVEAEKAPEPALVASNGHKAPNPKPRKSGGGGGGKEPVGTTPEFVDGEWHSSCLECGETFTRDTEIGAARAVSAHSRKHKSTDESEKDNP